MQTSTIILGGACVGLGFLYLQGRKQLETASGTRNPGFSLGGVLEAIRAGVKGYSGSPNESTNTIGRIGNALDGIFGAILGSPVAAPVAATDVRYQTGGVGPQLAHDTYRATELASGARYPSAEENALIGIWS